MDRLSKALKKAREEQHASPAPSRARAEPEKDRPTPFTAQVRRNAARVRDARVTPDVFEVPEANLINTPVELLRQNMLISHIDDKRAIDSYKLLRTRVLRAMQSNGWRSLGVTSAAPNAGKTLTSTNLAISISFKQEVPVLLVDGDLRIPSIGGLFDINPKATLREYLSGTASLSEVVCSHPALPNMYILPTAATQTESSELLGGTAVKQLIEEFHKRFADGVVIFDLPPVLVGDDVVAAAGNIDTLLFVVADGQTKGRELEKSRELLHDFSILGTVLNRSDEAASDSGYYYYYSEGT